MGTWKKAGSSPEEQLVGPPKPPHTGVTQTCGRGRQTGAPEQLVAVPTPLCGWLRPPRNRSQEPQPPREPPSDWGRRWDSWTLTPAPHIDFPPLTRHSSARKSIFQLLPKRRKKSFRMDSATTAVFSSAFDIKFIVAGGQRAAFVPRRNGGLIWRGGRGQEIDAVTINHVWAGLRMPLSNCY